MNYPDSVRYLYSLGNEVRSAKLSLEGVGKLLAELGDPQLHGRVIHVAGTNGKGSTCAMIESGLRAAGHLTGLYTSPHLMSPVERIRVAGDPVSEAAFSRAFDVVHAAAERLLAAGEIEHHPTYFETVTAMGFVLFREHAVEWTVVEVGLGGRLDATNLVAPELTVITPVDYDHEAWLGKTIEAIAAEKAGILKRGVPVVVAPQRSEAMAIIDARAAAAGAAMHPVAPAACIEVTRDGHSYMSVGTRIECPLAGAHQAENSRAAVSALRLAGVAEDAIARGIGAVRWPGRLERIGRYLLDGAHNPSGARALAAHLRRFYAGEAFTLIFGAMRDKSVAEVAGVLFPMAGRVIVTAPDQPRAARPETLAVLADRADVRVAPKLRDALAAAPDEGIVVITGSLFLVAEAMAVLR